jgi:glucose dehydrogenase
VEKLNRFDITDLLILVGLAFLFYGLWLINPPYAWIIDGASMLILAVLNVMTRRSCA